jgi:hypothetical protein
MNFSRIPSGLSLPQAKQWFLGMEICFVLCPERGRGMWLDYTSAISLR